MFVFTSFIVCRLFYCTIIFLFYCVQWYALSVLTMFFAVSHVCAIDEEKTLIPVTPPPIKGDHIHIQLPLIQVDVEAEM